MAYFMLTSDLRQEVYHAGRSESSSFFVGWRSMMRPGKLSVGLGVGDRAPNLNATAERLEVLYLAGATGAVGGQRIRSE
jgi:hypothetical protein